MSLLASLQTLESLVDGLDKKLTLEDVLGWIQRLCDTNGNYKIYDNKCGGFGIRNERTGTVLHFFEFSDGVLKYRHGDDTTWTQINDRESFRNAFWYYKNLSLP